MPRDGLFALHSKAADDGADSRARPQPPHPGSGAVAFAVIRRELDEHTGVLSVEGELDLASAPSLKWALADLLGAGYNHVVVDFSLVTFIDSTALGVLVGAKRRLKAGERLAIACAHPDVLNIFELTGLDAMFDIFSTFEDALVFARGSATAAG
jgi:anti-sigma B factor antagonist